jgi:mRNA interferase YafQ
MLTPTYTGPFKKDVKLMEKRRKNIKLLQGVMAMLIREEPLLPRHHPHPLHGNHAGKWECHVEPDWLLVYRIDRGSGRVVFHRTGTHSDLSM